MSIKNSFNIQEITKILGKLLTPETIENIHDSNILIKLQVESILAGYMYQGHTPTKSLFSIIELIVNKRTNDLIFKEKYIEMLLQYTSSSPELTNFTKAILASYIGLSVGLLVGDYVKRKKEHRLPLTKTIPLLHILRFLLFMLRGIMLTALILRKTNPKSLQNLKQIYPSFSLLNVIEEVINEGKTQVEQIKDIEIKLSLTKAGKDTRILLVPSFNENELHFLITRAHHWRKQYNINEFKALFLNALNYSLVLSSYPIYTYILLLNSTLYPNYSSLFMYLMKIIKEPDYYTITSNMSFPPLKINQNYQKLFHNTIINKLNIKHVNYNTEILNLILPFTPFYLRNNKKLKESCKILRLKLLKTIKNTTNIIYNEIPNENI